LDAVRPGSGALSAAIGAALIAEAVVPGNMRGALLSGWPQHVLPDILR
jgi:hypothetical protein